MNKLDSAKAAYVEWEGYIPQMTELANVLFDRCIEEDLLHWMPRKEVYGKVTETYKLSSPIPFDDLAISASIRKLLE